MHAARFVVVIALCFIATFAKAAGFRFIEVPADAEGPAMKGAMWTPCTAPPGEIDLGDIILPGVKDCPISGDKLPLVVISHGNHDNMLRNHDTAETLADAGFIVAAINHPGDAYPDLSRVGDLSVFVERPTDIKRLIDFILGASPAASRIDPQRIGFFGFSAGGYTGLVLIGANPDWAFLFCRRSSAASVCEQILRKEFQAQPLVHDARIKAAVIADPACCFFGADSFAAVKVPVQLWASERGTRGLSALDPALTPESVASVDRNLTEKHEYHVVPNAGHFAFWPPCPPALATGFPEGCTDAPGFDRVAFHTQFNADVLAFFRTYLAP
ncbi:MAG TPA: alpha/beta hydrolase [Steroidobacteraceae bacterium]|nr:alpha/beta hydrolase [Steroidobacteraceae bacterium]